MEFKFTLDQIGISYRSGLRSFAVPTNLSLASDGLKRYPEFGTIFAIKL